MTKYYNHIFQEIVKKSYEFIYTNFVGPIIPIRFGVE